MTAVADGWESLPLGSVLTLKRGYDLPKSARRPGEVPIVSSSGVTGFHSDAKAEAPGVVTGRYGTLGEVYFVDQPFWPHNTTLYVADFKGNDARFVAYLLMTLGFGNRSGAAAVPGINRNALHQISVLWPPLSEQRRIAGVLSAYDELIEHNTRRIKILEEMAQSIYKEWFVNFRYPGHESVPFVNSPLGPIPEGWERCELASLTDLVSRGISPTYNESSDRLVINQKCIRNGRLDLSLARRHTSKVADRKVLQVGDVLINSTGVGTLGRVTQFCEAHVGFTVDSHVTIVRPTRARLDIDFFGLALADMESEFAHMGAGSTGQTELARARISAVVLGLPPIGLQSEFGALVGPLRRLAVELAKMNATLRQTRDLLLPRLISGEVTV